MKAYEFNVYGNELREYMDGHDELDRLSDESYEVVTNAIIAESTKLVPYVCGLDGTKFEHFFINSTWYDDLQEVMCQAIDAFIEQTAEEIINSGEYEITYRED